MQEAECVHRNPLDLRRDQTTAPRSLHGPSQLHMSFRLFLSTSLDTTQASGFRALLWVPWHIGSSGSKHIMKLVIMVCVRFAYIFTFVASGV